MYTLIKYSPGIIIEGVVLAMGENRLRVAAAGFSDTIEFRRSGQQWLTSAGESVEFEFLMSNSEPRAEVSSFGQSQYVLAAG